MPLTQISNGMSGSDCRTNINACFTQVDANVTAIATKVTSGGALGTPSSGTATNLTGLPVSTGISGLGTGVATALAVNIGSVGAAILNGGVLGTPSSGTLTNCTGLPAAGVVGTAAIRGANTFTGAQTIPAGSAAAPTLNFTGNTNTGFFQRAGGYIMASFSGSERMHFSSSGIQIPSGSSFNFNSQDNTTAGGTDTQIFRGGAAGVIQLGDDKTTSASYPQRLQACNQISSNGAGAALTLSGGNGRGGAGGSLILATYSTAGSGVAGTLTTRLTINTLGEIIPVLPTSSAGLTTGALWNDTGTVKVA